MYEENLQKRMEASSKVMTVTAEEQEEDDDDCQICKDDFPEYWCEDCVTFICETCHDDGKGEHDSEEHSIVNLEEIEDDDRDEKWELVRANKRKAKQGGKDAVDQAADEIAKLSINTE